ncbi:MAG: aminotransferase class V-fold PLP-dependent enzyme [Candidatus Brocadiia bacterium]|nr:aminotransferase class V-fold PLP-dependent enzyme [Candidatus Brocadiia bacterium]
MLTYDGKPVRDQFEIADRQIYLRTGNICPGARAPGQAMRDFLEVWQTRGDACWDVAEAAFEEGKLRFARLIGAAPEELATIENTSMGLSMAAALIAPQPGSNVVVDELTHQSNVYPWRLRPGVEIRYALAQDGHVPRSEFERLVDDRTAAIDVCHVTMAHGFRHDLAALADLAHAHGGYLVVDAAQSAGVVPIDVARTQVDFLACPTFKWLLGPLGAGFLYVREGLVDLGPSPLVGWMSARNPGDFDVRGMELHQDARRLQRGVHNAVGLAGAAAGLRIIDQIGVDGIWDHVRGLSRRLIEGLSGMGVRILTARADDQRAGIVSIGVEDAAGLCDELASERILVGHYLPGQIRLDVALFLGEQDIDRTLEAVEKAVRTTA